VQVRHLLEHRQTFREALRAGLGTAIHFTSRNVHLVWGNLVSAFGTSVSNLTVLAGWFLVSVGEKRKSVLMFEPACDLIQERASTQFGVSKPSKCASPPVSSAAARGCFVPD